MKTPIAIYNLWHQGAKTLVSIGGVAFALLLVFMQLGFMGAVSFTATNVLEKLKFDILLRPSDYLHLYEASNFDRDWLEIAGSTQGIYDAQPFWVMIQNWRKLPTQTQLEDIANAEDPDNAFESQYLPIAVMAFEPDEEVFDLEQVPGLEGNLETLHRSDALLLDDSTKADYGPLNGKSFGVDDVVQSADRRLTRRRPEVGGAEFEIANLFQLGTGLAANAGALMGPTAFDRIYPMDVQQSTSLGLLRLEDPKQLPIVMERLRQRLIVAELDGVRSSRSSNSVASATTNGGEDLIANDSNTAASNASMTNTAVTILTREEALASERNRWLWDTPIGLIFQMGVAISLLVGAAIVYMVLSTDVANRLPEYATLLAMGYSRSYLVGIVMTQAMVLCGLGFLSAWAGAEVLYRVTSVFSGIPLTMDAFKIVLVGVLGVLMCVVSAILALRKLWKAEPANLF